LIYLFLKDEFYLNNNDYFLVFDFEVSYLNVLFMVIGKYF
jgi:hypothetical protein